MENNALLDVKSSNFKIRLWLLGSILFPAIIICFCYFALEPKDLEESWASVFILSLAILTGLSSFAAYLSAKMYRLIITNEKFIEISFLHRKEITFSDYNSVVIKNEFGFYVASIYRHGETKPTHTISVYAKQFVDFPEFIMNRLVDYNTILEKKEIKEIEEAYGKKVDKEINNDFKNVRRLVRPISAVSVALTIIAIYKPLAYHYMIHILMVLPALGCYLMLKFPNQIKFDVRPKSKYVGSQWMILPPSLAIFMRATMDWNIEAYSSIIMTTSLLTVLIGVLLIRRLQLERKYQEIFALVVIVIMYTFSTSIYVNCHYDNGPSERKEYQIVDFNVSNGKQPTYYVFVKNWKNDEEPKRIRISGKIYRSLNRNTKLIVEFRKGVFGSEWFIVKNRAT